MSFVTINVGHHLSSSGDMQEFLRKIDPRRLSVDKNLLYRHSTHKTNSANIIIHQKNSANIINFIKKNK